MYWLTASIEESVPIDWNSFFGTLASVTVVLGFIAIVWTKLIKRRISIWLRNTMAISNQEIKKQLQPSNGTTVAQLVEKSSAKLDTMEVDLSEVKKEFRVVDKLLQTQREMVLHNRDRITLVEEKQKRLEELSLELRRKFDEFVQQHQE